VGSVNVKVEDNQYWEQRGEHEWVAIGSADEPITWLDGEREEELPVPPEPEVSPTVISITEACMGLWFHEHIDKVINRTVPKAVEYGSHDLVVMGEQMFGLFPKLRGVISPEELAIAFYLLGKVSRIFGALEAGRRPSDDSWFDTEVYAQMVQYVRDNGRWG
jgi:hypothetical protein